MQSGTDTRIIGRRYVVGSPLGTGGMGAVYEATDRLTGSPVALKQILPPEESLNLSSTGDSRDFRLVLAQEFRTLASLRHPNIISVIDYGFDEDRQPFYTMELVENAQTILEAGYDRPQSEQVSLLVQMLQALAYLHRRGIIHRDLKPRNVLVMNGQVKVLDFGLSIAAEVDTDSQGNTAGTIAYMAPEVLMGEKASEAADLYAVGVIGYELLTGHHPYDAGDVATMINNILYSLADMSDIDQRLTVVVSRLLARSRDERYSSAIEVLADLSQAVDQPILLETTATRESFLQAARLVGRDKELGKLTSALDDALAGKGSAWLVGGESGVGKSRFVDELRALSLVRGALVLRGQAISEVGSPYLLWRPILRWLILLTELDTEQLSVVKSVIPDLDALVDREVPEAESVDPKSYQNRLLDVIVAMFQQQKNPLVVILEDLHWASESLDLLVRLTQIVGNLPLLIVGSYRDDERPELPAQLPGMNTLKLDRLTSEGIAQLSEAMLGSSGRQPHVVDLLQRETEGNVFFLVEVVRALAEEAGQLERIGMATLPAQVFVGGVQRIVQRRLARVPKDALPLLQLAAVMGRQLDIDVLRFASPGVNLDRWLTTCADAAVLDVVDDRWRFAHDKLRDGVLEGVKPEARRLLYERAAVAVEEVRDSAPEYLPLLAYYYNVAENPPKEAHYASLAGAQALRTGAYRDAISFLERSLELTGSITGNVAALKLRRMQLKRQIGDARLGVGEYERARTLYQENLAEARAANHTRWIADSLMNLGSVTSALADFASAKACYEESLLLYRQLDDQPSVARALNHLGDVAYETGAVDEARGLFQESLNLSRAAGGGWGMAGSIGYSGAGGAAEYAQAKDALSAALTTYADSRERAPLAAAFGKLTAITDEPDEYTATQEIFQAALKDFEGRGDAWGVGLVLMSLGRATVNIGKRGEAHEYLQSALKAATGADETALALDVFLALGRLLADEGDMARAVELLAMTHHHPQSSDDTQDEAERLLFDLENVVEPKVMTASWERGKSLAFKNAVKAALKAKP